MLSTAQEAFYGASTIMTLGGTADIREGIEEGDPVKRVIGHIVFGKSMKLAARGYIVMKGKGNRSVCVGVMRSLHKRCVEIRETQPEIGFWIRLMNDYEDIIEEMLDEFHVPELIDNEYPVLFVNVTFAPDKFDYGELTNLEKDFEMILIATG